MNNLNEKKAKAEATTSANKPKWTLVPSNQKEFFDITIKTKVSHNFQHWNQNDWILTPVSSKTKKNELLGENDAVLREFSVLVKFTKKFTYKILEKKVYVATLLDSTVPKGKTMQKDKVLDDKTVKLYREWKTGYDINGKPVLRSDERFTEFSYYFSTISLYSLTRFYYIEEEINNILNVNEGNINQK